MKQAPTPTELVAKARRLALWALVVPVPVGVATWAWALAGDPTSGGDGLFRRGRAQFAALTLAVVVGSIVGAGLAAAAEIVLRDGLAKMGPEERARVRGTRHLLVVELVMGVVVLAPVVLLALDASERTAGERSIAFLVAAAVPALVAGIAWLTVRVAERRRWEGG